MLLEVTLGDVELKLCSLIENIFNHILSLSIDMLNKNPKSFAEEAGIWDIITSINDKVLPIACSLLALFFFIGFCENCIDVKEELNVELCLKLFIRIGIAEYFVIHSIDIVLALFDFATGMAGIGTDSIKDYLYVVIVADAIYDSGNTERIVLLFPLLILFMVAAASAVVILMTVFMRFLRIWIAVPYGTLAFSTISSGSHWLNGTVWAFIKYMLSVLLEAFSLGIALSIGLRFILGNQYNILKLSGLADLNSYTPFQSALLNITNAILSLIILMTLVRTSQKIAGKVLALDR